MKPSGINLAGLDTFAVSDLMQVTTPSGRPLEIPIDLVREDENQARRESNPGFSFNSLQELAASIIESGGVKVPVSVQPQGADGTYKLNHGARRLRASKLAGFTTIRGFVDDAHGDYDQASENIQREAFTPMEIASFIRRRESLGDERKTIAKRLGKSPAYVTFHAALLDLPVPLRNAYDSGKSQDSWALYKLSNLSKKHPEAVANFVRDSVEISRSAVGELEASLRPARSRKAPDTPAALRPAVFAKGRAGHVDKHSAEMSRSDSGRGLAQVVVTHEGRSFRLLLDTKPTGLGLGWVQDESTSARIEVELAELRIRSITIS